jgi:hypothetical protein
MKAVMFLFVVFNFTHIVWVISWCRHKKVEKRPHSFMLSTRLRLIILLRPNSHIDFPKKNSIGIGKRMGSTRWGQHISWWQRTFQNICQAHHPWSTRIHWEKFGKSQSPIKSATSFGDLWRISSQFVIILEWKLLHYWI